MSCNIQTLTIWHFILYEPVNCFPALVFSQMWLRVIQANELCVLLHCGRVDKEDEMTCLIKGCNFVLRNIPHEAFVYAKHADSEFRFQTTHPDIFPYLLVNIGSGVSIVKVTTEFGARGCFSFVFFLARRFQMKCELKSPYISYQ